MLHLTISAPVSMDLVGLNMFRLARKNGSSLLSTPKIVFKPPENGKALARSFKFCNGDPKLCYAFILPDFNRITKRYVCRRISSASLQLTSESNKTSTELQKNDSLVSSVLTISSIAVLSCVGAVAFALNLSSFVHNYSVRRSDVFYT
nr:hypothetical transcript [Hymenolepis microstoma]